MDAQVLTAAAAAGAFSAARGGSAWGCPFDVATQPELAAAWVKGWQSKTHLPVDVSAVVVAAEVPTSVHLFTCRDASGKVLHMGRCRGWKKGDLPHTDEHHPKAAVPKKRTARAGKDEKALREEIEQGLREEFQKKYEKAAKRNALDAARQLAEMAMEVEELLAKGASEKGILHTLRTRMGRLRLEPALKAGEKVKFDPKRHDVVGGGKGEEGKEAVVVRPGYTWKGPDGDVLIERPLVQTSVMELIERAMRPQVMFTQPHLFTCMCRHEGVCLSTAAVRKPRTVKNPDFEKKIHRDLLGRFGDKADVPASKKRAPRKAAVKPAPADMVRQLRSGHDPEGTRKDLSRLTVAELGAVATELGRKLSGKTKAQKVDSLFGVSPQESARMHAARDRQARIDGVAVPGEIAAAVLENVGFGVDLDGVKRSARSAAVRLANDHPVGSAAGENALRVANVVQGAESVEQLDRMMRDLMAELGGELVGQPDDIVAFDARQHVTLPGERARKGQKVMVVRPGVRWPEEGITLRRADVLVPDAEELRARADERTAHKQATTTIKDLFPKPGQELTERQQKQLDQHFAALLNGTYPGGVVVDDAGAYHVGGGPNAGKFSPLGIIHIDGTLKDSSGKEIGYFRRQLTYAPDSASGDDDTPHWQANHDRFYINDPDVQGAGVARELNGKLYAEYRKSDFEYVTVGSAVGEGFTGGYAWPSQGFDFNNQDDMRAFVVEGEHNADVTQSAGFDEAEYQAQLPLLEAVRDRARSGEWVSAYEFSQIGRKPGQGKDDWWLGKALTLGGGFHGRMYL